MNILIIAAGFPHPESEDAIQKVYLLIQRLSMKHKIFFLSMRLPEFYKTYKPLNILNKDEEIFKNEFKDLNIDIFYNKIPNYFFSKIIISLIKIFSLNYNWFYRNLLLDKKISDSIEKINPDKVIVFYDCEVLASCIKNLKNNCFKIINFIGLMNFETEVVRMENFLRRSNSLFYKIFILVRFKFLILKLRHFFIQLCNKVSLNIFFDTDSVVRAKEIGIKNVEYCRQYVRDFGGENWLSKKKGVKIFYF